MVATEEASDGSRWRYGGKAPSNIRDVVERFSISNPTNLLSEFAGANAIVTLSECDNDFATSASVLPRTNAFAEEFGF